VLGLTDLTYEGLAKRPQEQESKDPNMQRQMGQCSHFVSARYRLNFQCHDKVPDMKISQNIEKTLNHRELFFLADSDKLQRRVTENSLYASVR